MDFKVSRKEKRMQPRGPVMELIDDIFDLYPQYGNEFDQNIITDVDILDNTQAEQLDRAMFAIVKQRGADPLEEDDGIQWAENILGEVPSAMVLSQVQQAVYAEGPGIRIVPSITPQGTSFLLELTNPNRQRIL